MYAKSIAIYGFKCFGKAEVEFLYPGRASETELEHPNINLILGDNGGGKSSVLRAIAIAALAPALINAGFVAYRLVRRNAKGELANNSLLKLLGILEPSEQLQVPTGSPTKSRRKLPPQQFLARTQGKSSQPNRPTHA